MDSGYFMEFWPFHGILAIFMEFWLFSWNSGYLHAEFCVCAREGVELWASGYIQRKGIGYTRYIIGWTQANIYTL